MSDLVSIEPKRVILSDQGVWWEKPILKAIRVLPGLKVMSPSRTWREAVSGSIWTLIGYGSAQVARLTTTVVLAHLLVSPAAFGLVALVNVFLSGLEMLSDLGVGLDIVQHKRGDDLGFINTAFLIQAGRGLALWGIATGLAYPFASFYKQPAVLWLLIVGATSTGLRGFTSGSVWTMTRDVQLKRLTLLTVSGETVGLLVAVAWALFSPTVWALVVGKVASTLVFVVGSHLVAEQAVSTRWDPQAAREILAFGTGIFISTATYFLTGEAERLVVGKFVNLMELGCFSLALTICAAATTGLLQITNQVFFPLISRSVREDKDRAATNFKTVRLLLLPISTSLAVGFIVGSRWVVALLLGPRYAMTAWILQLLGVRAALLLFMSINTSVLFAVGTTKYQAVGNTARLVILAGGLWIAFGHFGFHEAIWVLAMSPIVVYFVQLFGLFKNLKSVMRVELASFGAFLVCVGAAAGVASALK